MLTEVDQFRPDTHYQFTVNQSDTRNLSVLKDTLEAILLNAAEVQSLKQMNMGLTLVKYINESLKIVDLSFDKKKTKRFLLSYAEINHKAHISLFLFEDTESVCEDIVLIMSQDISHVPKSAASPLKTVQERPLEEDQNSLSFSYQSLL